MCFTRLVLILLLSISFTGQIHAQSEQESKPKFRLVIIEFQAGEGIPRSSVTIISDIIRTEMVKTRLFSIVERGNVDKILKEQAFQQSGCSDTSCDVQIGRLVASDKMLIGKVDKI